MVVVVCFLVIVSCTAQRNAETKASDMPTGALVKTGLMAIVIPISPKDRAISLRGVIFSSRKYTARIIEAIGVTEPIEVARLTGIVFIAYIHVKMAIVFDMLRAVCCLLGIKVRGNDL